MINFIVIVFCSLFVQLNAGVTPYNMTYLNENYGSYIDSVKDKIRNNYDGYWYSIYSQYLEVPNEYWVVFRGYYNVGGYTVVACPIEYVDPNVTSSIMCQGYNVEGDNNLVTSATLMFYNYIGFSYDNHFVENPVSVYGYSNYNFEEGNYSLLYCTRPIYSNETLIIDTYSSITPEFNFAGVGFGSLAPSGHSSTGSASEVLSSSGVTWSAHSTGTPSVSSSPHSSTTHINITDSSPDSNDDKQTNMLFMIINKLNDLIDNTGNIGNNLVGLDNDIVQGFSATFNAISVFNDNFVSTFLIDQEQIEDEVASSNMMLAINSSNEFIDLMSEQVVELSDQIEGTEPIDELVIPIDLTALQFPYYYDSTGTVYKIVQPFSEVYLIRFGFLDETKATWQPILIALLYVSLFLTIYFDLPNIIRGASRL